MKKINLFIIGPSKWGTTTLWKYLDSNPEICMDPVKEPCSFSYQDWDARVENRISQYRRENSKYYGEASPVYAEVKLIPEIPKRIKSYNPDAKIILMAREPIGRIYSIWKQTLSTGHQYVSGYSRISDVSVPPMPKKINRAVWEYPAFVNSSHYYSIYKAYRECFAEGQIKLMFYEDLLQDPTSFYKELSDFLDITVVKNLEKIWENKGGTKSVAILPFVSRILSHPFSSKVLDKVPVFVKNNVKNLLRNRTLLDQRLTEGDVKKIREVLKYDVQNILEVGKKKDDYWPGWF